MLRRTLHISRARVSRPVVACVAAVVVVVVVVMSGSGSIAAGVETAPGAAQAGGTVAIRRIAIATRGSAVVVTIEGSGNLPLPTAGFADEPPRIFFDFPGVTLAAPRMTSSHSRGPRSRRGRGLPRGAGDSAYHRDSRRAGGDGGYSPGAAVARAPADAPGARRGTRVAGTHASRSSADRTSAPVPIAIAAAGAASGGSEPAGETENTAAGSIPPSAWRGVVGAARPGFGAV